MSIKWSAREIQIFFDYYKKHEILWNIHRRDYRNRDSRDVAWEKLLGDLHRAGLSCDDVDDLKNRLRILKTVYMQEIRKIKNSEITAERAEEVYEPKLAWFEKADSFLRDVSRLRNSLTYGINGKFKKKELSRSDIIDSEYDDSTQLPPPLIASELKTKRSNKRKFPKNSECNLRRMEKRFEKEDEFDIVGKNVAMKLRILPKEAQTYTEKFINDILFEAKIGNISRYSKLHIIEDQNEEESIPQATELCDQEEKYITDED